MLYLLDTDHVSLWQHGHSAIVARVGAAAEQEILDRTDLRIAAV